MDGKAPRRFGRDRIIGPLNSPEVLAETVDRLMAAMAVEERASVRRASRSPFTLGP